MRARTAIAFTLITTSAACGGTPPPSQRDYAIPVLVASASPMVDAGVVDAAPPTVAMPAVQVKPLPITGATGPIFLDYIARDHDHVWAPFVSGSDGVVEVFDTTKSEFTAISGFKTAERDNHGKKRTVGPSSVSIGDGVAYVGNRGTSEVCVVDAVKLKIGKCLKLGTAPDGVAYIAALHEVWVTTPGDHSLTILDASKKETLKLKTTIKVDGDPEGYASVDDGSFFFTNLEDKNKTLRIDTKTHQVTATWSPNCGADGPRGIAADPHGKFVIVACTDHLQTLDASHDGAPLSQLDTGAGVDNIDFIGSVVYAAAGKSARMTIARVDDHGAFSLLASGATSDGARNAVGSADGKAYVVDGKNAQLLVVQVATQTP
jgi:hypothetical protein